MILTDDTRIDYIVDLTWSLTPPARSLIYNEYIFSGSDWNRMTRCDPDSMQLESENIISGPNGTVQVYPLSMMATACIPSPDPGHAGCHCQHFKPFAHSGGQHIIVNRGWISFFALIGFLTLHGFAGHIYCKCLLIHWSIPDCPCSPWGTVSDVSMKSGRIRLMHILIGRNASVLLWSAIICRKAFESWWGRWEPPRLHKLRSYPGMSCPEACRSRKFREMSKV